ncbi:regulator of replication initiation timing [Pullulanibacillus pueri]|nr:hypothetical protein [Pullulanibacillus pueri]MBM7681020.1 regulator of replication initiation timing [Pullulanibacillus pueri]
MNAFDALRKIIKMAKELDNIELNAEILELQSSLNDLIDENFKLKEELRALKGQKYIQFPEPLAPVRRNDKKDEKPQDYQELAANDSTNDSGSLLDF